MKLGGSRLSARRSFAPACVAVLLYGFGASAVAAATVEIKDGNIFVVEGAQRRQLTRSGRDADAVLAPDGKTVAFTRVGNPQSSGMQGDCKSASRPTSSAASASTAAATSFWSAARRARIRRRACANSAASSSAPTAACSMC